MENDKTKTKIENIKKALSDMESTLAGSSNKGPEDKVSDKISQMADKGRSFIDNAENKAEDKVSDKISQMADKGRSFIDSAQNKVNEVAAKVKEKRESYHCDEKHREKIGKLILASFIAFVALISFKKIKKHSSKKED